MLSNTAKSFRLAITLVITTVIILIILLVFQYRNLNITAKAVVHTEEVIAHINKLLVVALDNETGSRGYIITGDESFLEPLRKSRQNFLSEEKALHKLIEDNRDQIPRADSIDALLRERFEFSDRTYKLRRDSGYLAATALVRTSQGKTVTDKIRKLTAEMIVTENELLESRKRTNAMASLGMDWLLGIIITLILGILVLFLRNARIELQNKQASEARIRTVLESAPDAMLIVNNEQRIIMLNNQSEKLFGAPRGLLLGKNVTEILSGVDIVPKLPGGRSETGNGKEGESFALISGKTTVPVEVRQVGFASADGPMISMSLRDISARKKAEEKMAYQSRMIEDISDAVIGSDASFIVRSWNRAAETLFGFTEKDLIGKVFSDVVQNIGNNQSIYSIRRELQESGSWKGETAYLKKDGTSLPVLLSISATYDINGAIEGYVSVCRDITARKKVEDQMAYLASLIEQSSDAIISIDLEGHIKSWNRGAYLMYGYTSAEVLGRKFSHISHSKFPDQYDKEMMTSIDKNGFWKVEARHFTKDRHAIDVIKSITPIRNDLQLKSEYMLVISDITERKNIEEKVRLFNQQLEAQVSAKTAEITSIFNRITDGFIALDDQWNFTYLNQKGAQMINKDQEHIIGNNVWTEFPEARHTDFYKKAVASMDAQQIDQFVQFYPPLNSWFEIHLYPSLNGMSVFFRNVTQERIASQKLQESADQLASERNLLRTLIDNLPDYIYIKDLNLKHIVNNRANVNLMGAKNEAETIGKDVYDFFPADIADHYVEDDRQILKTLEAITDREEPITDQYGARRWLLTSKIPLMNRNNEPIGLIGISRDITDRKNSEEIMKLSEKKYKLLFENNPMPMWMLDRETSKIIDVNTAAIDHYGYNKSEFLALNPKDMRPESEVPRHLVEISKDIPGMSNRGNWLHRKKNGEIITVNISGFDFDFEGRKVRLLLSNDITETVRAEEELRLSEEKYKLLFYSNPLPMWIFEKSTWQIIDVNNAAINQYGYSRDEFIKLDIRELRDPEDVKKFADFPMAPRRVQEYAGIWKHRRKNGTVIMAELFSHDINFEGRAGRLVLANDVTEKLEAERKLRESYGEIRQLATHLQDVREEERAGIAREIHDELGQHLTGLKMDVSWISKRINPDQDAIRDKIKGIAGLLDDTVKIVRRISTELRPSILDDLGLIEAMEWQGQEFQKRSAIKVTFDSTLADLELPGNMAIGIFRIYQESLTNVARHAFATAVHTSFSVEDDNLLLRIKDNGAGFDVASIKHKKTLGLLGMKERTLILGGIYEITSSVGNGTLVSVSVPLHSKAAITS